MLGNCKLYDETIAEAKEKNPGEISFIDNTILEY